MAAGASSADRPLPANAADPPCPTVATVAVAISSTSNTTIRFTQTPIVSTTDVFARSGTAAGTSHWSPVDMQTGYRWTKTLDAAPTTWRTRVAGYQAHVKKLVNQADARDLHALQPGQGPEAIRGEFGQFVEVPAVRDGSHFFNETQFFTDEAMTKSFAFGLRMHYIGTSTDLRSYWADYTTGS